MNLDKIIAVRTNKTIYLDRKNNIVVKVFDSDFSKADILNEALNQARIEETGLKIPKIKSVTTVDGKWAIVSEYIKGKTLSQLIKENPEKFDEYLELFVNLQIEVHSSTAPKLNSLKDKMSKKISMADLDATTRYDLHTRLQSMPTHYKICHGDFNPSNIVISEDNISYVLDWSHVTHGNASADVARTYLLFWLEGQIEPAKKYLDLFCKKSNISKKYIESWMPIVAASESTKNNSAQREFLLSWVNVVDYQ
ncbi:MAG: phosphotransferase [Oscillospiraceae bacterium]|nr:phosphotransferase [Oscillospiraceae bacterium]